jgi:outer membrane protein OmpU
MKKILIATTALVATTGFAAADVNFSGEAGMGLGYDDSVAAGENEVTAISFATLSVSMTGETDGGLGFGADFDITAGSGFQSSKANEDHGIIDTATVYIEGGFGKLSVGDVDNAIEAMTGLSDIGFDGLGTDDVAELLGGNSKADVLYTGTFGDFSTALSYDTTATDDNDWALGLGYNLGDYAIALGYDSNEAYHVQVGTTIADFNVQALYSGLDVDGTTEASYGLTAGYTFGAATVTAAYSAHELNGDTGEAYGLGVSYDLGGGATLDAGIADIKGTTKADFGINMSF